MDAELWAGKIARVLRRHPKGVGEEDLARESGLTHEQIQRGVMWQNTEAQRWLEQQHGQEEDDGPDAQSCTPITSSLLTLIAKALVG